MGLYDLTDFLNFDDVADYLTDKGVYSFDLSDSQSRNRLYSLLYELVASEKLTPVFRYNGFMQEVTTFEQKTITANKVFLFSQYMIEVWKNSDYLPHFEVEKEKNSPFPASYKEFRSDESFVLLEDKNPQYGNEPLFPKVQLDNLFLQQQKDNLQRQINAIDSQFDELPANSKNSASKLLYALMMNGGFELDGTKKGNLNDRLVSLTKEKGVPVTENFISNWLEYLNDKYYF